MLGNLCHLNPFERFSASWNGGQKIVVVTNQRKRWLRNYSPPVELLPWPLRLSPHGFLCVDCGWRLIGNLVTWLGCGNNFSIYRYLSTISIPYLYHIYRISIGYLEDIMMSFLWIVATQCHWTSRFTMRATAWPGLAVCGMVTWCQNQLRKTPSWRVLVLHIYTEIERI